MYFCLLMFACVCVYMCRMQYSEYYLNNKIICAVSVSTHNEGGCGLNIRDMNETP
jgi:hypothetical protein